MSMTFLEQLGIIPALLIALAGGLVLHGEKEHSRRRLLLFFLWLGTLLLLALYLTMRFITEPYDQPYSQLASLLMPSLLGMMAMVLLNLRGLADMGRSAKVMALLLGLMILILFALFWNSRLSWEYLILPGALVLAIGWSLFKRFGRLATILGLLSVIIFLIFNWMMNHPPNYVDNPMARTVGTLIFAIFFVIPGLSMVVSAILITDSLQTFQVYAGENSSFRIDWKALAKIGFALALPVYLAYIIFWGSVWDHTSDGLTGLFMLQQSGLVAIGAGMTMILALNSRYRLAGVLFIIAVPLMLYQSFEAGWRVSYHEITEKRATRIALALDQFREREGYYPSSLDQLVPRDLLFIQQPVILSGEKWCYQGGGDQYRLAAFYREFFSAPVSLRSYASVGELPIDSLACANRLAEMKEKYYSPMEDPAAMRPPIPTPLPEIEVGMPKIPVQPVLDGAVALPGSWSPDSAYFLFATRDDVLSLHFLNGKTGEICDVQSRFSLTDGIRENYAWLPDGRLLYLDSGGDVTVMQPCQPEIEQWGDRLPDRFTKISSYEPETGKILLQSKSAFWILNSKSMEAQVIHEVTPVQYEFHWDKSAWLPGGESIVIGHLNGRKGSNAGATLYMIDAATGMVQNSLDLDGDFGQSAPWIEGLSQHEVLFQSQGKWLIADFEMEPVKLTDVMESIFGLEIQFPDEVSASGSHIHQDGKGYYLAVRLNHPHNQSTYLYDSVTGKVYVYDHKYHTLLLFPDGYLMEMPKLETVPTYTDEYNIVFVNDPGRIYPKLTFTGHTPREYPSLSIQYLMKRSQFAVASAHGVSLVDLADGKMEAYWSLLGEGYSPWLMAAPDDSSVIAEKDFGGLYYIPLP